MAMLAHPRHALLVGALIFAPGAHADVYQCVDAAGKMLLTDSGCPPEYRVNLVVSEPQPVPAQPGAPEAVAASPKTPSAGAAPAGDAAAAAERKLLEAEAEADLLRDQLQLERERSELTRQRLEAIEDKLDALADMPAVYADWPPLYGGVAVPLFVAPEAKHRGFHGKAAKPHDRRARIDKKPRAVSQEARRDCGIFGCTPTITHAPWDDRRREPARRLR